MSQAGGPSIVPTTRSGENDLQQQIEALQAEVAFLRLRLARAGLEAQRTADSVARTEARHEDELAAEREEVRDAREQADQASADLTQAEAANSHLEASRAELSLSKDRLAAILESASDFAIFATDLRGRVVSWNKGAENVLGWSEAEMLGRDARVIFTPEDRVAHAPEMEMAGARSAGRAEDVRWHIRKDGSRFWANGLMMPLRDADGRGEPRGYLKILRDETDAHLAGEAREASARQHAALVATQAAVDAADGDLDAVLNAVVQGALAMTLQADGAQIEVRDGGDMVYRAAAGASASHVGLRLNAGASLSGLCVTQGRPLVCADTETDLRVDRDACRKVGIASMMAVPVPHHGRFVGVLKLHAAKAHALTEADVPAAQLLVGALIAGLSGVAEAKAGAALRLSEARLKAVFDTVPVGILLAEAPSGRIIAGNAQVERIFGHPVLPTPDIETYGRWISHHPDGRQGEAAEYPLARVIRGEAEHAELEVLHQRGDGRRAWVRLIAAPIRDDAGQVTGGVVAVLDIRREKQAEAALRNLNATLKERVAEEMAEREKTEDQLRQAQKMEAVGQLTGGIAHDFNNLLTGVSGSLELMQRRIDQGRIGDLGRYMGVAQTSVQRAAALTHRLLAFARRQPLHPKPTDVNALVAGMEDLLRRTIGGTVVLETVLASGLWPALCDAHQLENAVLNLSINARDAMPDGGRLTVETANSHLDEAYARTQPGLLPGDYVCVSVSDTGLGMPPEVLARVFEPFFTTKPIGQGTGLGLSMVYGFVKQLGGHIRIHSAVGQGASVRLYLPRQQGVVETPAKAATADLPRAQSGETVLVVEDEAAVRLLVTDTLRELGYAALEAVDGRSALPILEGDSRIDLLVSDVGLPGGLNGRQLADMARERRPGLRVLFITGYAEQAAVRHGFLDEGMEMIGKPFALDALAAKIREMIGRDK